MKPTLIALFAVIATASAGPIKDQDKLQTRATGMGENKLIEIIATAGEEPLTVVWGVRIEDRMTLEPGERKTRKLRLGKDYKITAFEKGRIVDTESALRKTGLGKDRSLR